MSGEPAAVITLAPKPTHVRVTAPEGVADLVLPADAPRLVRFGVTAVDGKPTALVVGDGPGPQRVIASAPIVLAPEDGREWFRAWLADYEAQAGRFSRATRDAMEAAWIHAGWRISEWLAATGRHAACAELRAIVGWERGDADGLTLQARAVEEADGSIAVELRVEPDPVPEGA